MSTLERRERKHTDPRIVRGGGSQPDRGYRIQATQTSGRVREEGAPPIDTEAARAFWDLLEDVRDPHFKRGQEFRPSPELEARIATTLNAAIMAVPGISRESLDKIIRIDPYNYENWIWGGRSRSKVHRCMSDSDFPLLAANWDNDMYADMRQIAEKDYGVGELELDFLRAAFEQQPPSTPCFGIYDLQIYAQARKAEASQTSS